MFVHFLFLVVKTFVGYWNIIGYREIFKSKTVGNGKQPVLLAIANENRNIVDMDNIYIEN